MLMEWWELIWKCSTWRTTRLTSSIHTSCLARHKNKKQEKRNLSKREKGKPTKDKISFFKLLLRVLLRRYGVMFFYIFTSSNTASKRKKNESHDFHYHKICPIQHSVLRKPILPPSFHFTNNGDSFLFSCHSNHTLALSYSFSNLRGGGLEFDG